MGQDQTKMLQNELFNIKMASKSLARESAKATKKEGAERKKAAEAMRKGNMEAAEIYAQNSMAAKAQSLSYLRLSSRMDGIAAKVETALAQGRLTKSLKGVTTGLDKILGTMNVTEISKIMDRFCSNFEELDLQSNVMQSEMDRSTAGATKQSDVQTLLQEIADENNLIVSGNIAAAPTRPLQAPQVEAPADAETDDFEARFAALKAKD